MGRSRGGLAAHVAVLGRGGAGGGGVGVLLCEPGRLLPCSLLQSLRLGAGGQAHSSALAAIVHVLAGQRWKPGGRGKRAPPHRDPLLHEQVDLSVDRQDVSLCAEAGKGSERRACTAAKERRCLKLRARLRHQAGRWTRRRACCSRRARRKRGEERRRASAVARGVGTSEVRRSKPNQRWPCFATRVQASRAQRDSAASACLRAQSWPRPHRCVQVDVLAVHPPLVLLEPLRHARVRRRGLAARRTNVGQRSLWGQACSEASLATSKHTIPRPGARLASPQLKDAQTRSANQNEPPQKM